MFNYICLALGVLYVKKKCTFIQNVFITRNVYLTDSSPDNLLFVFFYNVYKYFFQKMLTEILARNRKAISTNRLFIYNY